MIKVNVALAQKRSTGDYENNTYHVGFEIEDIDFPSDGALRKKVDKLFQEARLILQAEQVKDGLTEEDMPAGREDDSTQPDRATNKQIKFIFSLARNKSMTNKQVQEMCKDIFGCEIDELSKRQASDFIAELND